MEDSENNAKDAKRAADILGISYQLLDFSEQFRREVIGRFARGYEEGVTPNPCVICNRQIKFGLLLDHALGIGWDKIATGHYARIEYDGNTERYLLKRALDESKDQTYVLYSLAQQMLSHTVFPLGGMRKNDVRKKAAEIGLLNAEKPDSQDICFVEDGDYAGYLTRVCGLKSEPGDFVDTAGNAVGRHKGLIHYTIGQRKGLNLSLGKPVYVVAKDIKSNTVVVGDESELYSREAKVADLNFIPFESLREPKKVTAKTRYSQKDAPATIFPPENGILRVEFDNPQRAVTPGQAAVFYQGEIIIGGGKII
jgi:tRNA-specific 2-thiouridylase